MKAKSSSSNKTPHAHRTTKRKGFEATRKSKINVRLLRKIQKHILEEPRRLYMGWYIVIGLPGRDRLSDHGNTQTFAECGTMACIAGWSLLISKTPVEDMDYFYKGMKILGLNYEQAARLFYDEQWPEEFSVPYRSEKTPQGRAIIAAKRIDHFIKYLK